MLHSTKTPLRIYLLAAVLWLSAAPAFAQAPQMRATVNGSAVITTGNTFQTVLSAATASARRLSLTIANNNATDSCWLFIGSGSGTVRMRCGKTDAFLIEVRTIDEGM